jgi:acyl-CoA thioester hydrolase
MFDFRLTVRGYELDSYGHVNHAVYVNYLEQARWVIIKNAGLLEEFQKTGIKIVVVKLNVRYMREIGLLDEILVQTRIKKESPYLVFYHFIKEANKNLLMARAVVKTILLGKEKKPLDIPDEMIQKLELYRHGND